MEYQFTHRKMKEFDSPITWWNPDVLKLLRDTLGHDIRMGLTLMALFH